MGGEMGFGGRGEKRDGGFADEYRFGVEGRRGVSRDGGGRRPSGEASEDGFGEDGFLDYDIESSDDEAHGRGRGQGGRSRGPPRGGRSGGGRW